MRKTFIAAAVLSILAAPSTLLADTGFYVGLQAGVNLVDESKNDSSDGTFLLDFDPGYFVAAQAGYDLGTVYPLIGRGRIELEVGFRGNAVKSVQFAEGSVAAQGDINVLSVMVNAFGEAREFYPFIPYAGAGVGLAHLSVDGLRVAGRTLANDSDTVFAWQVGGGLGLALTRQVTLDLGYRYFSALNPEFEDSLGLVSESEYNSHTVILGARYTF